MNAIGVIRKISIGDIKEGITYKVGQTMMQGRLRIEQILCDLDYLDHFGINKYDVYVTENDSENIRLWKSFVSVPMSLEYDISVEYEDTE